MNVLVKAPAKINLALRVGAPRPDGFHPLDTVFTALDLADDVLATTADGLTMSIEGRGEDLPVDESNLVMKAARALQRLAVDKGQCNAEELGAHIHITKRIPVAGGMAGGSADAAGTLVALNELWGVGAEQEELLELAADLGSDVPFALFGGVAHGTGRGELLTPVGTPDDTKQSWIVLVNSEGLSTPAVFKAFDELFADAETPANTSALRDAIAIGDNHALAEHMINDLQPVAEHLRPDLAELFAQLNDLDGVYKVMLSGSGPSIVLLVEDDRSDQLATELGEQLPNLDVVQTTGPARGAHVVHEEDHN